MALISVTFLAVLLAHLTYSASVEVGIINGNKTKKYSRPYMVSVQNKSKKHICGGFLVSDQFVMTAAHCLEERLTVVLGAHDLSVGEPDVVRIPVKRYHIHPMYNSETLNGDIMLLQLNKTANRSKAINWITLPKKKQDIKSKMVCSAAGWGAQKTNGSISNVLMEVNVSIIDQRECYQKWRRDYDVKSMVCAGGKVGICQGDSGGPLVCKNTAVGIVSFTAKECNSPKRPDVYTKISAFLPWINAILHW